MLVCEKCHEKDRDATLCQKTALEHKNTDNVIVFGACNICEASTYLVNCYKYPRKKVLSIQDIRAKFTKGEMINDSRRCSYCTLFGECDKFVQEKCDLDMAKYCMTFIPEEGNHGQSKLGKE